MSIRRYLGTIVSRDTGAPVPQSSIEAFDSANRVPGVVAAATADDRGQFALQVDTTLIDRLFGPGPVRLYFRVTLSGTVIASTERTNQWNPRTNDRGVIVATSRGEASPAPAYTVEGIVADVVRGPLADTTVSASSSVIAGEGTADVVRGTATSDARGHFKIVYGNRDKLPGRLIVQAWSGATGTSEVLARVEVCRPAPRESVDLIVGGAPGDRYQGKPRLDTHLARVTQFLRSEGRTTALKDLTPAQVDVLTCHTGLPATEIQQLVDAAKLNHGYSGVSQDAFYALLSQGFASDSGSLFSHRVPALVSAIQRAVVRRVVSPSVTADVTKLHDAIENAALAVLRGPPSSARLLVGTLIDDARGVTENEKTAFLKKLVNHSGTTEAFWSAIDSDAEFTATARARLAFAVEAGAASGGFFPVVRSLHDRVASSMLSDSSKSLATLDETEWRSLIDSIPTEPRYPEDTPGANDAEKRTNYARSIARNVENRFRTAVIRDRVRRTEAGTPLLTFFSANADFEFERHRVGRYLAENPEALTGITDSERPALIMQLRNMERVFRITDQWANSKALLDAGFKSSQEIDKYGRDRFVAAMTGALGGAANAHQIFDKACWTANAATMIRAKYSPLLDKVRSRSLPNHAWPALSLPTSLADWSTLFGTPDACLCEHCRSVLGPASYLADVFQLLKTVHRTPGGTARDELFGRRPDLPRLALSCPNAETAVPYVDLVNEILEVRTYGATWPTMPAHVDTTSTSADLLALPDIIYPKEYLGAYTALNAAVFPFVLPFHLWQEEARIYLAHLGVRRSEIVTLLASEATGPDSRSLALERLGTSGHTFDIIAGPPSGGSNPSASDYWGIAPVDWPAGPNGLHRVRVFLEQSGLTFDELRELLATNYCVGQGIAFQANPPCDVATLTLTGLSAAEDPTDVRHHLLHRLLRLRTLLGWSITDTDRARVALGDLSAATLEKLGGLREIQRAFPALPPVVGLAWYADMDRNGSWVPSLFERVFLNGRVVAPSDAAFASVFATGTSTVPLANVRQGLLAALQVTQADLGLLIDAPVANRALALPPAVDASANTTLGNLSRLFRLTSFAQTTGMRLADAILLRELSGIVALSGDDGAEATPDGTLALLNCADRLANSGLTLDEVHYLLRHVAAPGSPLLLDAATLDGWRSDILEAVQKVHITAQEGDLASLTEPDLGNRVDNLASKYVGGVDAPRVRALADNPAAMSNPTASEFIVGTFSGFLGGTDAPAADALDKLVTNPLPSKSRRYEYLIRALDRYASRAGAVYSWAAQTFGITEDAAAQLLSQGILVVNGAPAVRILTVDEPVVSESIRNDLLARLQKTGLVVSRFALTAAELAAMYPSGWTATVPPAPNGLPLIDWNAVPIAMPTPGAPGAFPYVDATTRARFEQLLRMSELGGLRDRWRDGSDSLFGIFALAGAGAPTSSVLDAITAGTGWDRADIGVLATTLGVDVAPALQSERSLLRLEKALALIKRLGVSAQVAKDWINVEAPIPASLAAPSPNAVSISRDIRLAARAKHDDAGWASVARALRDPLREKQRAALVGNLLRAFGVPTPAALYEQLLVDVEMSPCALTSRIVLAHSTVQLFVQRILLNLESQNGLSPNDDLAREWQWMKNYRVWEANRKVFLWPENWIEPELRDDKTPLFEDMEKALLSGPLEPQLVEDAYRAYLDGLADLANLEIVAIHAETTNAGPLLHGGNERVVHVFGRTAKPHAYYHRARVSGTWAPWERIDLTIQGDHLLPFTFGGRLYLMWAIMEGTEKHADPPPAPPPDTGPTLAELQQDLATAATQADPVKVLKLSFQIAAKMNEAASTPTDNHSGTATPMELSVRMAVSELRGRTWTPPVESQRPVALGAAPFPGFLSFLRETADDHVKATLLHFSNPIAEFTYYPGTYVHEGHVTHALTDPVGTFGNPILATVADNSSPIVVTKADAMLPSYQSFSQGVAGLQMYMVEHGVADTAAVVLQTDAGGWRSIVVSRDPEPAPERPEGVFVNGGRSFFIDLLVNGLLTMQRPPIPLIGQTSSTPSAATADHVYRFEVFYHPFITTFRNALAIGGLDGLLRPSNQASPIQSGEVKIDGIFEPSDHAEQPFPKEIVDFRLGSPYGVYNWELFFHAPLLIATSLMADGRYADAQRWFHAIFDPTDGTAGTDVTRYWKFRPFADNKDLSTIQSELEQLALSSYAAKEMLDLANGQVDSATMASLTAQIHDWRENPFEPHAIARVRIVAYQKTVVMKYVENLLAWADSVFSHDSIESLNEATQLYVFAANVLGPKPTLLPSPVPPAVESYSELDAASAFDAFSNALVDTEVFTPRPPKGLGRVCGAHEMPPSIVYGSLYFCIPPNEKLLGYWDTVADRLFKIRHCMNIEGVVRALPLFEPPIDPALLVRAAAAGVDLSTVVFDVNVGSSPYRYSVVHAKAMELASAVASLGQLLLSVLEKGDAEALAQLRQRHEVATQELTREVRRAQVDEAQANLDVTRQSLKQAQARSDYYSSRVEISSTEQHALDQVAQAQDRSIAAQVLHLAAGLAAQFPDATIGISGVAASPVSTVTVGGRSVAIAATASADALSAKAASLSGSATELATRASYRRRKDDWDHQANLADLESQQIQKQIEAATVRLEIANHELAVVEKQIAQTKEVENFLTRKFTNADLYGWMKQQIGAVYYQAYKLAYDLAKRAENAFKYERADDSQSFITFGYWDSLKRGLLAGEKLVHDLRRLDAAYLAQNVRELELIKNISLAKIDPERVLEIREVGSTAFSIGEEQYDRDHPTHYLRRLKSVAATLVCTTGAYQGVHGTLALRNAETRLTSKDAPSPRMAGTTQIVTSGGDSDAGLFEVTLRDDRLLPFEGAGAHYDPTDGSTMWSFDLSGGNELPYESITDLVLQVRYTARDGRAASSGNHARKAMFNVLADFEDAWEAFRNGTATSIVLPIGIDRLPKGRREAYANPLITAASCYAKWSAGSGQTVTLLTPTEASGAPLAPTTFPVGSTAAPSLRRTSRSGLSVTGSQLAKPWQITPTDTEHLIELWVIFDYSTTG